MKNFKRMIIFVYSSAFIGIAVFLVSQKEILKGSADVLYLKLAPVDPRSLMQGDYMRLRYELLEVEYDVASLQPKQGSLTVYYDEKNVAQSIELPAKKIAGKKNANNNKLKKRLVQYKIRANQLQIAADTFFFQEGSAKVFEQACYASVFVDTNGKTLLSSLHDCDLKKLEPLPLKKS